MPPAHLPLTQNLEAGTKSQQFYLHSSPRRAQGIDFEIFAQYDKAQLEISASPAFSSEKVHSAIALESFAILLLRILQ
jgi:hypothetical protein